MNKINEELERIFETWFLTGDAKIILKEAFIRVYNAALEEAAMSAEDNTEDFQYLDAKEIRELQVKDA